MSLTYVLRALRNRVGRGVTSPLNCDLAAVYKQNGPEAPFAVYNELVASRLAHLAAIPVATGVLVSGPQGLGFASVLVGFYGISIPLMSPNNAASVARRYVDEAALVFAFDAWIGNRDRHGNIKAVTTHPATSFFVAFDHSHSLLGAEPQWESSIECLASEENFVRGHPFAPHLQMADLEAAVERLGWIHPRLIEEACREGLTDFVPETLQVQLGEVLLDRRNRLLGILRRFMT